MFRVVAIPIAVVAVAMFILNWNKPERGVSFVAAVLATLAIPIMRRLGRTKVRTDDTGITIVNFFDEYHVPWANAFGVQPATEWESPRLVLTTGGTIALPAVGTNGPQLDQLEALIEERRE